MIVSIKMKREELVDIQAEAISKGILKAIGQVILWIILIIVILIGVVMLFGTMGYIFIPVAIIVMIIYIITKIKKGKKKK